MSGGRFDYLQGRYEWDDAIETISNHISENPREYEQKTIDKFEEGLLAIKKARVYLQRIDWLLSDDDGEKTFHERLEEDLTNISL